ncbi:MAG: YlxM family DNA-binding protein [Saccharofermentans sp.]|nr:YlxM family DNA-binding protein [Saccharofermentans sp.]
MKVKSVRIGLLLDFYGNLLTDRMRITCEEYYNDDLSLAEIAQDEGITRQGVYDTIRRAGKQLEDYEERLGLLALFEKQQDRAKKALKFLTEDKTDCAKNELEKLIEEM